jgi:serine/threonine protein kinase
VKGSYDLKPGQVLADTYTVLSLLGSGWEGEVYRVRERRTRIERAAKLFYPHRNPQGKTATTYARKLHKLRRCEVLIRYHSTCKVEVGGEEVTCLVSECVEGELLSAFLARQRGKRLTAFQAVHLLYGLACGVERIHQHGEYHGDLHSDNVIVQGCGLEFDLKLLDLYKHEGSRTENQRDDLVALIHIFYESLGGKRTYANQPDEVKQIVRGLKRSLILDRFRSVFDLCVYLENLRWG